MLGLLGACAIIALGSARALTGGAHDFRVFYAVWKMVLAGHGQAIYDPTGTPDRFLYAPCFAWAGSLLALLPETAALVVWCLAKAGVTGLFVNELGRAMSPQAVGRSWPARLAQTGIAAWALVLLGRPMLVDLGYGQVNTLILGASVWALHGHFGDKREGRAAELADVARWAVMALAAVTKVFPLPILAVPWLVSAQVPRDRLTRERAGVALGLVACALAPMVTLGLGDTLSLYTSWYQALLAKGLPLESHNQSFVALLHHYFSGQPTFVISEGLPPLPLGLRIFSEPALALLSLSWTLLCLGAILTWLIRGPASGGRAEKTRWSAVLIALLIVPSHLIWKPYFVLGIPAAVVFLSRDRTVWLPVVLFLIVNFTGFDFLGHGLGPRFEAAAVLLMVHLVLIARSAISERPEFASE